MEACENVCSDHVARVRFAALGLGLESAIVIESLLGKINSGSS